MLPAFDALLAQTDRTLLLVGGRTVFALLLIAVQLYVLRAMRQIVRSMQLTREKERTLSAIVTGVIIGVNLPLGFFLVESFISPHELLLYAPPMEYESMVRPFAYTFFVWTIGSLIFAAAAPVVMACFAAVQFFRRKRTDPKDED